MSDVVLIRHCQSSGQEPEAELTDLGRRQAEELALHLVGLGIDRIVSSAYRRAVATIEPFAAAQGITIELDPRLRERRLSGESLPDWLEQIERTFEDFDYCAPGGESSREAQGCGCEALSEIARRGVRPAIVSHGNLMTLLLHSVDPGFAFDRWKQLTNPDVYLLRDAGSGREALERVWSGA